MPSFISAPPKNSKTICTKMPSRSRPRAALAEQRHRAVGCSKKDAKTEALIVAATAA
jgi:hypothetical protein